MRYEIRRKNKDFSNLLLQIVKLSLYLRTL